MRRTGLMIGAVLGLAVWMSAGSVMAQNQEQANCTWSYKEGYSVDLPKGTFEECAQAVLDQITQFALEEGYGYWGDILIYVDYKGNVYYSKGDGTNQDDWVEAGSLTPTNPESSPNINPSGSDQPSGSPQPSDSPPSNDSQQPSVPLTLDEVFQLGAEDINDYWVSVFDAENINYDRPQIVLFSERSIRSACGRLDAAMGPVYCPNDHTGYFPRGFMQDQLDQIGDFAVVVIIGHEWGHSIQAQTTLGNDNEYTIDNELQADCFAGSYSQYAKVKSVRVLLEAGDIEEGANAIFLVGDPDGTPWFDENAHGTGEQRLSAFSVGLDGDYAACLKALR